MKIINLEEVDLSYDIQYIEFMLRILEPYITFKNLPNEHSKYVIKIYRNIEYYWRHPNLGKNRQNVSGKTLDMISLEEYIYFIQSIFPKLIQSKNKEEFCYEECKEEILIHQRKTEPRFKLPIFSDLTNIEDLCVSFLEEINKCSKEEIKLMKEKNKENLERITKQISYLEKIQEINREKNGSIRDVIYFIQNLGNYIGKDT